MNRETWISDETHVVSIALRALGRAWRRPGRIMAIAGLATAAFVGYRLYVPPAYQAEMHFYLAEGEIADPTHAPRPPRAIREYVFNVALSRERVEQVMKEYDGKVRFVYRDYPLNFHPRAVPASVAARCAGEQNKFWDYHNHLMVQQGDLSDADLEKRALRRHGGHDRAGACKRREGTSRVWQSVAKASCACGDTFCPAANTTLQRMGANCSPVCGALSMPD